MIPQNRGTRDPVLSSCSSKKESLIQKNHSSELIRIESVLNRSSFTLRSCKSSLNQCISLTSASLTGADTTVTEPLLSLEPRVRSKLPLSFFRTLRFCFMSWLLNPTSGIRTSRLDSPISVRSPALSQTSTGRWQETGAPGFRPTRTRGEHANTFSRKALHKWNLWILWRIHHTSLFNTFSFYLQFVYKLNYLQIWWKAFRCADLCRWHVFGLVLQGGLILQQQQQQQQEGPYNSPEQVLLCRRYKGAMRGRGKLFIIRHGCTCLYVDMFLYIKNYYCNI